MNTNTNNLNGFECESWQYRKIFVFLQQWLEKILTYLQETKDTDNIISLPFFEIKKIGRTKYANYRHVRSTNGILGILSFNARYLLATPSSAHYAGYVVTLAHNLARCLAMRKKTPDSKNKIRVSKKEIDAELLEIGLKYSTKDGYQFCLNSWIRDELTKDYGKGFSTQFMDFEEKPVKQNLGEQVTIENAGLNEQTQCMLATESNVLSSEQTSEQLSILKQTVADLEQDQKEKVDEIAMYKRLADERYATMTKMQEAFEQEKAKIRAEIASLKITKVESAPAPVVESKVESAPAPVVESKVESAPAPVVESKVESAPAPVVESKVESAPAPVVESKVESAPAPVVESKVESAPAPVKKQSLFSKLGSLFTAPASVKKSTQHDNAERARLALQWLKENEASIQKTDKKFVYSLVDFAKKIHVSIRTICNIDTNPKARLDVRSCTLILNFAKRMGYVESKQSEPAPAPVVEQKVEPVIESAPATTIVSNDDNDDDVIMTEQDKEEAALNEVASVIQTQVAAGPKDRFDLYRAIKAQSFIYFREPKYDLDTMITRLVDRRQLQCCGDTISRI